MGLPIADAIRALSVHARNYLKTEQYRSDPVAFAREVLRVEPWEKQQDILRALIKPPHQVLARTANEVGKSWVAAVGLLWFYMTRDPSISILTAPNKRQVDDITFKEIRTLYGNRAGMYPKASRLTDHPKHLLYGFTARHEAGFQGMHEIGHMVCFDEAIGIDRQFWSAARGVLSGGDIGIFLAICNPTDSASEAYLQEQGGGWKVISISAFDHPNIKEELLDRPAPIPGCVRLASLKKNMVSTPSWGVWISESDFEPGADIDLWQFPGGEKHFPKRYWRPGPEGCARILGIYPLLSAYSLFSEMMFAVARSLIIEPSVTDPFIIGCDVARFGDDSTCIHIRRGMASHRHIAYQKQDTAHTAGQLKELCNELGPKCDTPPKSIPVLIDDSGVGGGVVDQRDGYNFIPVIAQETPFLEPERYPNVRSEIMFVTSNLLCEKQISLARLDAGQVQTIQQQAVQITYKLNGKGQRVVEEKRITKERIGRSPDDLDAFNLAYYPISGIYGVAKPIKIDKPGLYGHGGIIGSNGTTSGHRIAGMPRGKR